MPKANANATTTKKADQVMENQLEIPDFNFGQPVKKQPEVNVQVIFEKGGIDKDEKDDLFMMYAFAIIITVLNFILLYKQVSGKEKKGGSYGIQWNKGANRCGSSCIECDRSIHSSRYAKRKASYWFMLQDG